MIKALIDTNIILDLTLARIPFYEEACLIFQKMDEKTLQGFVSASAVTDIFYMLKKEKGSSDATDCLTKLLEVIEILGVDKKLIINALALGWADFEDAVQAQVAIENGMDVIITRNVRDFQKTEKVKIMTPQAFVATK